MEHLAVGLGHTDWHAGLRGYCTDLILPGARKSVEPMAARIDPLHVSARHQALARQLPPSAWQTISWREGTNNTLS